MSLLTAYTPNPSAQVKTASVDNTDGTKVTVKFPFAIIAEDYTDGVTINVNAVAATISAAARSSDHKSITYTLSAPVVQSDAVEFVYDASAGSLSREDLVIDVDLPTIPNLLGANPDFSAANNSGQYIIIL